MPGGRPKRRPRTQREAEAMRRALERTGAAGQRPAVPSTGATYVAAVSANA